MIVVADSGSTKTDWRVIDNGEEVLQIKTEGINPYYMTVPEIKKVVHEGFRDYNELNIEQVYFYGSGCSSDENKQSIKEAIGIIYPKAVVYVSHDLMAAARSLCGSQRGIACILGTGSNSALYDGKDIIANTPSLGYILGDEGSGNHLGRTLIQSYYKNRLSQTIKSKFDEQFGLSIVQVLEHTYQKDMPVRFFSSFSKFIGENIEDESIHNLVHNCFSSFIIENVMQYNTFRSEVVYFTGSVAYFYKKILLSSCEEHGVQLGDIVKEPINGLLSFHGVNS